MMEDINEQLEKRDMILRYFKQVDYNLKPTKDIYTRIKTKIIGLSGINAKPDRPYAELCQQAGLNVIDGKALIESLFNKELVHMIKKYDTVLVNQEVEAYYIDKQYTRGLAVPDVAMVTYDQALNYIVSVLDMRITLGTLNNIDLDVLRKGFDSLTVISDMDRARLHDTLNRRQRTQTFNWLSSLEKDMMKTNASLNINLVKDLLVHCIDNTKADLLGNLLTEAAKKNPNVNQKFYCGSCDVNKVRYYLFPI